MPHLRVIYSISLTSLNFGWLDWLWKQQEDAPSSSKWAEEVPREQRAGSGSPAHAQQKLCSRDRTWYQQQKAGRDLGTVRVNSRNLSSVVFADYGVR
jgi:hypothetical protein